MFSIITVRYAGPTDSTGSRFIVNNISSGKRTIQSYSYSAKSASKDAALSHLESESINNYQTITHAGSKGEIIYFVVEH